MACSVFITNNKSPLYGQKRMILRVKKKTFDKRIVNHNLQDFIHNRPKQIKTISFYPKEMQELARKTMQAEILRDILVDMQVCELEGWDKMEYLKELQSLINHFNPKT